MRVRACVSRISRTLSGYRATMVTRRAMSTYYTKDHEYLKADGDLFYMGISDHAQSELGDVVFVELPDAGATFDQVSITNSTSILSALTIFLLRVKLAVRSSL